MNEPHDFIALVIAIMAAITSKEVANLIGPYAAVIVLALAGSGLALSSYDKVMSAFESLRYVLVRMLLAVTLTVSVAELLQAVIPWAKPRYSMLPIAFGIGMIRDYKAVMTWLGESIKGVVGKKLNG
jgi:hypothetical protein